MIEDARALQADWVPREVQHRNAELNALSSGLAPVERGESAGPILLTGPSGVGKTCLARYTLDRLRESVLDLNTQYVNGWRDYTRFRALYRILDGVGETLDIHRKSTPHDELLDRLRDYDGPPYVVVLDEVDQLEETRILYDLLELPPLSLVLIANREEDLFGSLDDRVVSRLHAARRVRFEKYGVEELTEILRTRARWGLHEDAVTQGQLRRVADTAAGDARIGIAILRNAAREAERESRTRITDELFDVAVPEARQSVRASTVEKLNDHQVALYEIIEDAGEIEPPALYDRYADAVDEPRTDRTVRNYLQKMVHYNLISAEGETRDRVYRLDPH
jgi:Cdc6-like AAA superfamily ATPase